MNNTIKKLTPEGKQHIDSIASRYDLSQDTVLSVLQAVVNGGGNMAQFNISELGGSAQWMRGGMTMVGDMFNNKLKNTVQNLCQDLANLILDKDIPVFDSETATDDSLAGNNSFSTSGNWWPADLGSPSSSGSQNNIKYAFFPSPVSRLAIEINGELSVYDTLNHQISGVSQQQGKDFAVAFTSQLGKVDISNLPLISGVDIAKKEKTSAATEQSQEKSAPQKSETKHSTTSTPAIATSEDHDIFNKIDRLAELLKKGVLTEEEFSAKKVELLARL